VFQGHFKEQHEKMNDQQKQSFPDDDDATVLRRGIDEK
jgi:hypothetical protein